METAKHYNFLIVEDNPADARLISRELRNTWENILVKEIAKPQELRTALAEIKWDVVIADYYLPSFTGFDALRILQESDQNPPFFLISGIMGEEIAAEIMNAGAYDFVDKNNPGRLIVSIKRALKEMKEQKELNFTRAQLLKSEKKYKDIISLAPIGFYQISLDGRFLEINSSFATLLGYDSIDEFMNHNSMKDVYYTIEEENRVQEYYDNTNDCIVKNLEIRFKKKDGTPLWVMITTQAIQDVDDNIIYYNGFMVDISQLKSVEKENQRIVKHWQNTFNSITDVIMMLSTDLKILEINQTGCRELGKSRSELIGEYCYKIVHNSDTIPDFCPVNRALKSHKMEISQFENNGKTYLVTAWPIFDNNKELIGFSHVIKDMTHQKKAEKELQKHREHLEELVQDRTAELKKTNEVLKDKNLKLENLQVLYKGRENRIKDLRDQVKELKHQLEKYRR